MADQNQWFKWMSEKGKYCTFFVPYHLIRDDAQVKPLPNAAKQIKSSFLILSSAHASLNAMGIDAAVVLP